MEYVRTQAVNSLLVEASKTQAPAVLAAPEHVGPGQHVQKQNGNASKKKLDKKKRRKTEQRTSLKPKNEETKKNDSEYFEAAAAKT